MRPELLRRIGEISDAWDTTPLLLGVFGSFARRDGDSGSDIDLLLVTKAKDADEQAGELSGRVRTWTGNQCHVMALTPTDISRMRRNKEGILKEWDRDLELIRGNSDVLKGRS
jgi:predicted nucleotidyltransferase